MEIQQSKAYWMGRVDEADREIAQLRKLKSAPMKKRLKKAQRLRLEALEMIANLSGW